MVKPLDLLADILDRLMARDLKIEIKEPKSKCSREIRELYQVFGKIRIAMRFGQETTNDAEALISYSQALRLFEEFNNTKGMRICCSQLGAISRRNMRLREAVDYFLKAYQQAEVMMRKYANSPEESAHTVDIFQKSANDLSEALMECSDGGGGRWEMAVHYLTHAHAAEHPLASGKFRLEGMLLLAEAFISQRNWDVAQKTIDEAQARFHDPHQQFSAPASILQERITYVHALYLESTGNDASAAELYTQCLTMNDRYDPQIRRKCLLRLHSLLSRYGLWCWGLQEMVESLDALRNEVVVVCDYSTRMKEVRESGKRWVDEVVRELGTVITDALQDDDRVALYLFHSTFRVAFSLTPRSQYRTCLEKNLQRWTNPSDSAHLAVYDAVLAAVKEFGAGTAEHELLAIKSDLLSEQTVKTRKWMLLITTAGDAESSCDKAEVIEALRTSRTQLFSIGLSLTASVCSAVQALCDSAWRGEFRNCRSTEEVEEAFARFRHCLAQCYE